MNFLRLISVASEGYFTIKNAHQYWNEYKRRKFAVSKIHDLLEFNIVSFTQMKTKQNSTANELNNQSILRQFEDYQKEA